MMTLKGQPKSKMLSLLKKIFCWYPFVFSDTGVQIIIIKNDITKGIKRSNLTVYSKNQNSVS